MTEQQSKVAQLLRKNERDVLQQWLSYQISATTMRADLIKESDLREQSRGFCSSLSSSCNRTGMIENAESWKSVKDLLGDVSRSRVVQGFSPSETATFIFSLKQPIFDMLRREIRDVEELCREIWAATALLDKLGLVYHGSLPAEPRVNHLAPATRIHGAIHSCGPALGQCPRTATDRYTRQRTHSSGDGELARESSRDRRKDSDHRYHRRSHCGHTGCATSTQKQSPPPGSWEPIASSAAFVRRSLRPSFIWALTWPISSLKRP